MYTERDFCDRLLILVPLNKSLKQSFFFWNDSRHLSMRIMRSAENQEANVSLLQSDFRKTSKLRNFTNQFGYSYQV